MKKFYIATTIALALLFNITIVSQQTSAYIISCVDEGQSSDGAYYKRCLTSSSKEGFQVFITCVNILNVGGTVYGNVAKSGEVSSVKCPFGQHIISGGQVHHKTVAL